ncbi:Uncharacterized protein Rs2_09487 [Raphanus sativus]|nr:Uncharacterized protein Rs2_09487 [Raphanus sativus]
MHKHYVRYGYIYKNKNLIYYLVTFVDVVRELGQFVGSRQVFQVRRKARWKSRQRARQKNHERRLISPEIVNVVRSCRELVIITKSRCSIVGSRRIFFAGSHRTTQRHMIVLISPELVTGESWRRTFSPEYMTMTMRFGEGREDNMLCIRGYSSLSSH